MKLDYADLDAPGLSTIPWAPLGEFRDAVLPLEHLASQAREGLLYRLRTGGRVSYHALHEGALRTLPRRRGWTQLAQRKAVAKANRAATRGDPYTVADHAEDAVLLASAPCDHWNSYLSPAAVSRSAAAAVDEANAAASERDRRTPARARALECHAE